MLRFFREALVDARGAGPSVLAGVVGWDGLFAPLLEIVGEDEGVRLLREVLHRDADDPAGFAARGVEGVSCRRRGPGLRSHAAALRHDALPPLDRAVRRIDPAGARPHAAGVLGHLRTARVARSYPETRARFFLDTVFRGAPAPLVAGLEEIVLALRRRTIDGDALLDAITDLRARLEVTADDDYFLARLSFPYLRPEDAAGFVQAASGGRSLGDIVVTLEDQDGAPFQVRHALSPKEVGRLHRLFVAAKLDVRFRARAPVPRSR